MGAVPRDVDFAGDIETVARKNGLKVQDVVDALNQAAFGPNTETDSHASH